MKYKLGVAILVTTGIIGYSQQKNNISSDGFITYHVEAELETDPVVSFDDAADDVCIWENKINPSKSLVVGTDKDYGLIVYDLKGKELNQYPLGRTNNVALFDSPSVLRNSYPIVCATNRTNETITFAYLLPNGELTNIQNINVNLKEVYGITTSVINKIPYIIVSDKRGYVKQYLVDLKNDSLRIALVRTIKFKTIVEGLVVDENNNKLYVAEENKGLWQLNAVPGIEKDLKLVLKTNRKKLKPDFEGLAIRTYPDGSGWIIMSVQELNSYAFIDRISLEVDFLIQIKEGKVDGVQDTDGLDVSSLKTKKFPNGIFIVQDGENGDVHQNFKYINWVDIEKVSGN